LSLAGSPAALVENTEPADLDPSVASHRGAFRVFRAFIPFFLCSFVSLFPPTPAGA
jgi:hypothetical protein